MGSSQQAPDVLSHEPASSSGSRGNPSLVDPPADDVTVITHRPVGGEPKAGIASQPVELGRLLAGERLDHFELLGFVGGGGMGAVFRARDTLLNREVALKVLPRDQGNDEENRRRFRNEAQSAARLDHENIARVYYVGEDKGLNYIVFEFIEGLNLRQLVEQHGGPLSIADSISFTWQVAKALEHAHSREVVHRDIKPSNVIITAGGKAKLVDMGLARLHDVDQGTNDLTASGVTLGTFDYISPEQARDPRNADVRSDLYSLGCTLYFMLAARPPFPEGTVLQKLLQHNSDAPPDPREVNPDVPEELARIVARLLAKNPLNRFQTPRHLIGELHRVSEMLGLSVAELGGSADITAAMSPAPWWERHLPWAVPLAGLATLVLAIEYFARPTPLEVNRSGFLSAADASPIQFTPEVDITPVDVTPPKSNPSKGGPSATKVKSPESTSGNSSGMPMGPVPMGTMPNGTMPTVTPPTIPSQTLPGSGTKTSETTSPSTNDIKSPTNEPATTETIEVRSGVLVVTPDPNGPQQYASLRAACSAAKNGDIIELRYSGVRDERPIELKNRRLTIRAADNFAPVIRFQPNEPDPLRYARSMINVLGGRVVLENIRLELDVPSPRDLPADQWSLIAMQRADAVELQSCVLTVRNYERGQAQHPDVAFIHLCAAAGFDAMMADGEAGADEVPSLQLQNCVVRGEAVFLKVSDLQAARVVWENGLLSTSERLLTVLGGQVMGRQNSRLNVSLRHLTASMGQGFCKFDHSIQTPYVLETSIECRDSILRAGTPSPLIDQERVDPADALHKQFGWTGERNFYVGFDRSVFWRITEVTSPSQTRYVNFEQWQDQWGSQGEATPRWEQVTWRLLPPVDRPPQDQTPLDYALGEGPMASPARGAASDGLDVGQIIGMLPLGTPAAN